MILLDTALRLMVIGQAILLTLMFVARGLRVTTIPIVLLKVCVAAYLIQSSPVLSDAMRFAEFPIFVLSMACPYIVWTCAYVLFGFDKPAKWIMGTFPIATIALCGLTSLGIDAPDFIRMASITASLVVIVHAVYSTLSGGLDDLCQRRRYFRMCFVICVSFVAIFILTTELVFIGRPEPAWLPVTNVSLIAVVLLLLSIPMMVRPKDLLPQEPNHPDDENSELDAAEQETYTTLLRSMQNRAYARTGLTIRQLAEELGTPEHHLRALINTRLGYKNFSTFLNRYRIDEACERLQSPKEARVPILTIALDAGFASLAPFNRAFRREKGMTPTEFRRANLKPAQVVTPIRR